MRINELANIGKGDTIVMRSVTRDMSPEEMAEYNRAAAQNPQPESTEDKVNALMQYMGLHGRWNGSVFEVTKAAPGTGDY